VDKGICWVGLDAHKKTIAVAVLLDGRKTIEEWAIEHNAASLRRLVRQLDKLADGREIRCCYEAGPCGYALQRQLDASGKLVCEVIAPSLIPSKPGDRIKTDRRDARKLAELLRAGLLTTVRPPSPEQEARRDLCRCREDVREDLGRNRHRLQKMLVRRGIVFDGTSRLWGQQHRRWLREVSFENAIEQTIFDDYMLAIDQAEHRLKALDTQLEQASKLPLYREPVAWLRCFRGIDTITAMTFVCELHGFERFQSPRQLAAYLGLVPKVFASADTTRRGGITKTGNGHVRRALIQSAWQYRHRPGVGRALRERRRGQPARVVAIAERAQHRLCRRYRRMIERGKPANKVVVAVVRELVGFLWAALQHDSRAPQQAGDARHGKEKRAT
jgi:transposase